MSQSYKCKLIVCVRELKRLCKENKTLWHRVLYKTHRCLKQGAKAGIIKINLEAKSSSHPFQETPMEEELDCSGLNILLEVSASVYETSRQ